MKDIFLSNHFIYGGDYNPEQWLDQPDILKKDITLMKKAGINTVTLGVFSWSVLEPQENEFHFEWLHEIIDSLYCHDIRVILATPSGSRPRWLAEKYPEVLRVQENRMRYLYGERHNHCYTSPAYRERVRIINQKLAENFKNHPAVIMWHISNEYRDECHCPLCQNAFRNWLKSKYQSIDKLNHAWWTTFWSHTYNSFDQIESPSFIGDKGLHGLSLDWKRFVTDQTTDFMCCEIKALRDAGATQPAVVNFMDDYTGLNYYRLAEHVEYISWDSYPAWHQQPDIQTAYDTAMQHDLMRSMKQKPFFLMESCPASPNWMNISKIKKPSLLSNASLQAIAHGSCSVQFFQIRQSRGGFEKFHGAVIDHYGEADTRVFREVSELGKALKQIKEITNTRVHATAAVLYDMESRWAMENAKGPRNEGLYYHEAALKSYRGLRENGLNTDIINMDQSLEQYQIIAAPMLYMFRNGFEKKLKKFVEHGGILIMTYWSGIVDETDLCFLGGTPHGLMDVLGLRSEEIDSLCDHEVNHLLPFTGNPMNMKNSYSCKHLCDLVRLKDAEPLMVYGDNFYKGYPALTRHKYGKGIAYYVCADAEMNFYHDLYNRIITENQLQQIMTDIPDGIEVSSRSGEKYEYLFIQNYTDHKISIRIPKNTEILWGSYDGGVCGYSTVICRKKIKEI